MTQTLHIGFLIFPQMTPLDAVGPAQILSAVPGTKLHYVWKTPEPVETDAGFSIQPTDTLDTCPQLDVLCVPGGLGQPPLMTDDAILSFLARQAAGAKYVTSVCTGSLLLGAAGLLDGYKASCHWAWHHLLAELGATPVKARVVRDRNRISGGGVTAGVDFGLAMAAELVGEDVAKLLQLAFEYDPEPPFDSGSPAKASADTRAAADSLMHPSIEAMAQAVEEAVRRRAAA